MADGSRDRCRSISIATGPPTSATKRCCWRVWRRRSWRVIGLPARRRRGPPVPASWSADDGLQNPSLRKDCSIVVVDGQRGIGNGRVFPAGPLRAPLEAQLDRAQAVLIVGEGVGAGIIAKEAAHRGMPVFHAKLAPDTEIAAALAGRKLLAFAGIGDPGKFFATLAGAGCEPVGRVAFADHHPYTVQDARALLRHADRDNLVLVTTEKDLARLAGAGLTGEPALAELAARARALPVRLVCDDVAGFRTLIFARLGLGH